MSTPRDFFTVSRVLQMTGLHIDTLDMLHRELGDALEVRVTSGGNRLFTPKDIANLKEIKRLLDDEGQELDVVVEKIFPGSHPDLVDTMPGTGSTRVTVNDVAALDSAQGDDPAATQTGRRTPGNRAMETEDTTGGFEATEHGDDGATLSTTGSDADQESTVANEPSSTRVHVTVEPGDSPPLPVEIRSSEDPVGDEHLDSTDATDDQMQADEPRVSDVLDSSASSTDDVDPDTITVPPLPVGPTVDLLLEATEGLVQENLKLRKAVDILAERCVQIEERLADRPHRGLFGFLRR